MKSFSVILAKATTFLIITLLAFPIWANAKTGKQQNEKNIYTVIEFESSFMNRRKEKILEDLGEPDVRSEHRGKEVWTYQDIIREKGKIWHQSIMFDFGRVNMMWGEPSDKERKY